MEAGEISVRCCIAGGGPAGMMLGFLLARAGVSVLVLEKHADFLRDFRGDTIHPSTLEIMHELGLLDEFLQRPHQEARTLSGQVGDEFVEIADFTALPTHCRFIAFMPQWDFLDFLAEHAKRYPELPARDAGRGQRPDRRRGAGDRSAGDDPGRASSRFGPIWSSAPTGAIRRCARGPASRSSISARRWMCCGCGCRGGRGIPGRRSAGSTRAGSL